MEQRHVYGGTVAAMGVLLGAVQVVHGVGQFAVPLAVAVDVVPFVALSLALSYVGYWLTRARQYEQDVPRIAAWGVGGTVVFASIAALVLFGQQVTTGALGRASVVAIDHITVGALSGTLVGLYDARSRCRYRALQDERDRTEAFAGKAADLNNYGRAIAQSESVEGVAAFCVEAVATLIDVRESVFVEADDDGVYVVSNTVVGTPPEAFAPLVDAATRQDVGSVVVRDGADVSADLGRSVGAVLSVHVTERDGRSVVLLALVDEHEPDAVGETDRQLLELLVSHASMALETAPPTDGAGTGTATGAGQSSDGEESAGT